MAKKSYMGVSGKSRQVKKVYIGVGGVARKVKKIYIGVNGVAKQVFSSAMEFTYNGTYKFSGSAEGNWELVLLTSGTLNFKSLGNAANGVDVFIAGGGASGARGFKSSTTWRGGAGGAGGYLKTQKDVAVKERTNYTITIGAGGSASSARESHNSGGQSSALGYSANGGSGRTTGNAAGGTGADAEASYSARVPKAGSNGTKAFSGGGISYSSYNWQFAAGGGGGACKRDDATAGGAGGTTGGGTGAKNGGSSNWGYYTAGGAATTNTGSGGGGGFGAMIGGSGEDGSGNGGAGGSGIVIIRNKR